MVVRWWFLVLGCGQARCSSFVIGPAAAASACNLTPPILHAQPIENPLVDLTADRDDVREGYGARKDEDAELK